MSLAGKRCLVLGGGGFLGINLCYALLRAGADVEAFGRPPHHSGVLDTLPWHRAEFSDISAVKRAVTEKQLVFHVLGGSVPVASNANPAEDVETSVLPTLQLIHACREARIECLVFASSGGTIYGPTGRTPIPETTPTDPITAYGINKLAIEKYLGLYHRLHGLKSVILRISNPYGPFQHSRRGQGAVGALLRKAIQREPLEIWGDGSIVRDFVHVEDVARAMLLAADYSGPGRVFNVGSGVGRSLRQVVADVLSTTGATPELVRYLPGRSEDVPVNVLDIRFIRGEMEWQPLISWPQGLAATAEWVHASLGTPDLAPST